jgi:DMSO/TMAO reductase YedYZ molybdopterin-dependent catalytic subunit
MNRRNFIALIGGGLATSLPEVRAEHRIVSADPLVVETDLGSLEGRYTPTAEFYVRDHTKTPTVPRESPLLVEGEVGKPLRLTPEGLTHLEKRQMGAVLECAGNPVARAGAASCGLWEGWLLADVLSLAQPYQSGRYLHLYARDGFVRSVPIDRGYNDALLVTGLNRYPLGRTHGAPWRVLFPGWYAMDSVKWLERILVSTAPQPSHGNEYLEVTEGPCNPLNRRSLRRIQVKSIILSPASGSAVPQGRVQVKGLAWSGEGRISTVEVSGDGGTTWRRATADVGTRYEWAPWRCSLELNRRGATELVSRATDNKGIQQPERRDPARLDGYGDNWWHRVRCVVM